MAAVKTVADARTETAGPAFPLVRRRLGNRDRNQTVHAGGRVMLKPPGKAAVDHHLHPFDGQARFGDVRRQNDLSFCRRENRPLLLFKGEVSVKRMNGDAARFAFQSGPQGFAAGADFAPAGQEDENVAGGLPQGGEDRCRNPRVKGPILLVRSVALFHRKGFAR